MVNIDTHQQQVTSAASIMEEVKHGDDDDDDHNMENGSEADESESRLGKENENGGNRGNFVKLQQESSNLRVD